MAIRSYKMPQLTVDSGSVGTVVSDQTIEGRLVAVYLDYSVGAATTDVVLSGKHMGNTYITVSNTVTDAFYYPSVALDDASAGDRAAFAGIPIVDQVQMTAAQGSVGATIDATLYVEY